MDSIGTQSFKIVKGACQLFFWRVQQMEPPDNIGHPLFISDPLGVGNDIADPGMGTAGDDDQSPLGFINKC